MDLSVTCIQATALCLCLAASPAAAQTRAGAGGPEREPLGLSLTFASDYRSKGASKTGGRPQLAAGIERAVAGRAYLAASASNIRNSAGSDAQLNLSAGWRPEAFGLEWNLNSTHEIYPGSDTAENDVVWQLSAEAARKAGPLSAAVILQHQPDGFAATGANTYLALDAGWRVRPGLQAVAGLGRREQDDSVDYTAWNAGLVLRLSAEMALDARWHATNQDEEGPNYQDRFVAAVRTRF